MVTKLSVRITPLLRVPNHKCRSRSSRMVLMDLPANSGCVVKVVPSYMLSPTVVPTHTCPRVSAKIDVTKSVTSPSWVVKWVKSAPSYRIRILYMLKVRLVYHFGVYNSSEKSLVDCGPTEGNRWQRQKNLALTNSASPLLVAAPSARYMHRPLSSPNTPS